MVAASEDSDIDDEIDALRRAFVERLPTRVTALIDAMAAVDAGADDVSKQHAIGEVGNVAHGISGSAGLFGFHELADAAEALETACEHSDNQPVEIPDLVDLHETVRMLAAKGS